MIQTAKAIAANAEQIVKYANDIGALCLDKRYTCVCVCVCVSLHSTLHVCCAQNEDQLAVLC